MTEKEVKYIQELDDEDESVDWKTPLKKISNWITRNRIINQIDFFSLDVKFLLKGEETFRTTYAGIIGILMYLTVGILTYYIAWPTEFTSRIIETLLNQDSEQIDHSIYLNNDIPISLDVYHTYNSSYDLPPQYDINFFEVTAEGKAKQLKASRDCPNGHFCLKSNSGESVEIYGGKEKGSKIVAEILWCNATADPTNCQDFNYISFHLQVTNVRQAKQVQFTPYKMEYSRKISSSGYDEFYCNVTRQIYTSNTKFLGHLSNILPQTILSYQYDMDITHNLGLGINNLYSDLGPNQEIGASIIFLPSGMVAEYNEEFVDVGGAIVFFFALLDPVRVIINMIFVKWYNLNSRDLYIANKLFYIEDTQKHQKFDFNSGAAVFFTCLLHRHIISIIAQKILSYFGKNFNDVLPKKCIHTIAMINKGESMLHENNFFGTLEQLSTLEDCPAKKIPFIVPPEGQEEKEEEEIEQADYFPESAVKKQAFTRFCKFNEIISAERKNNMYEVLRDEKYTTTLKDLLHKQFNIEVRNVRRLIAEGVLNIDLNEKEQWSEDIIPVQKLCKESEHQEQDSAIDMKISVHQKLK